MPRRRGSFVRAVIDAAASRAPSSLGPFTTRTRWSLGQLYSGNPALHYEVWRRERLGVVEIGLHFEADALTNARLLGAFRMREHVIREQLGTAPLLEEWDKGWARIYESYPLSDDEDVLARTCVERLTAYIRTLEPILREELPADVPWELERRPRRQRARV